MQLKPNLKLRKLGPMYMVVDANTKEVDTTRVYTLNDTAAWLWERAAEGDFTIDSLTALLCEEYDVAPDVARHDVEELLNEWKELIL